MKPKNKTLLLIFISVLLLLVGSSLKIYHTYVIFANFMIWIGGLSLLFLIIKWVVSSVRST